VPVAVTGISSARFRGRVLIRLGEPIRVEGRPTRRNIERYSAIAWHAIRAMVEGDRDLPPPGRFTRWLTDVFNDWGEGGRAAAARIRGPRPEDVPVPPPAPSAVEASAPLVPAPAALQPSASPTVPAAPSDAR